MGSPPHTRGIPGLDALPEDLKGFTPAYAGNTFPDALRYAVSEVHPRIRGEYP